MFQQIHFADGQIRCHWYRGACTFTDLVIHTDYLTAIHANAFNEPAFENLRALEISAKRSSVIIHGDALNGTFGPFFSFAFNARRVRLPNALFNLNSMKFRFIIFDVWSNGNNLNEMFTGETFGGLVRLEISNVDLPQDTFRYLHASNFTPFRHLQRLDLINCGIEVIDSHAFDVVGRTLKWLHLDRNWIKVFNVETFRILFETKNWVDLTIDHNREQPICSCRLFEFDLIVYPFDGNDTVFTECKSLNDFMPESCGIERIIDSSKYCIVPTKNETFRTPNIRITYRDDSIRIKTNFSEKIRMLFTQLSNLNRQKCNRIAPNTKIICLNINKSIEYIKLNEIYEIDDAEILSVTAIPILFHFGARPIHSIMVRREAIIDDWPCFGYVGLIVGTTGLIFGFVVGFSTQLCIQAHEQQRSHGMAHDSVPYEYGMPSDVIYTNPYPYEEAGESLRNDNNYIEITDTGYVAIHGTNI